MKKLIVCIVALFCLLSISSDLYAQPAGEITLDHIDGEVSGNYIKPGQVTFYLRMKMV